MTETPTDKKLSERVKTCVEEFNNARAKNLSNTGGKGVEWVESRRFDDCAGLLIDNADATIATLTAALGRTEG